MPNYSEDPEWADIVPFPQDDGGPNPLAAIAYTDGYSEAMSYLRAIMAKNEMSERALALTEDIIDMNAAHYTVWLYRARILSVLPTANLHNELEWLNETALNHQKNYQIWHHRQFVIDQLDSPAGEVEFINKMFEQDAKNYHVWSYRQWLVRRFSLWDDKPSTTSSSTKSKTPTQSSEQAENGESASGPEGAGAAQGELTEIERLLDLDVRNNSAWNHRFFLINGRDEQDPRKSSTEQNTRLRSDPATLSREIAFAKSAIRKAPQNQSPWNYLRGTLTRAGEPLSSIRGFAEEFASLDEEDKVRSSHALEVVAEVLAAEKGQKEKAGKAYDLLAIKFDPIRANYWNHLKGKLGQGQQGVVA